MNYKKANINCYDKYAEIFEANTWKDSEVLGGYIYDFLREMKMGFRILDLGCGPGRCTEIMRKSGYVVTDLDISRKMLELSRRRNPRVVLGDLENMPFLYHVFDGIWSSCSLIHMPKSHLPDVLNDINNSLRTLGI